MDLTLLGVRLLLAAVFVVAAIGKLRDLRGFRRTLGDFRVPPRASRTLGVLVPAAELVTSALLVPTTVAWWGAASSLVLLTLFSAAVAVNLLKGRAPDCRCFGQFSSAPVGVSTLVRNLVLASGAALLLVMGSGAGLDATNVGWATTVLLVAGLAALVQYFRQRNDQLSQRVTALEQQLAAASSAAPTRTDGTGGLPVGAPAPPFELPLLAGDQASLETLTAAGTRLLLIFSSSHCPACAQLWPDISRWQRDHAAALRIAVIGSGSAQAIEMKLVGTDVQDVLLADDSKLLDAYHVPGIPCALVVTANRTVGSDTVMGPAAIRDLVRALTS